MLQVVSFIADRAALESVANMVCAFEDHNTPFMIWLKLSIFTHAMPPGGISASLASMYAQAIDYSDFACDYVHLCYSTH
jgi:hypothetical protein